MGNNPFDDLIPQQSNPFQDLVPSQTAVSPIDQKLGDDPRTVDEQGVSEGTAMLGGISSAAVEGLKVPARGANWLINRIGVTSPETKKSIDQYIEGALPSATVSPNSQGDVFEKSAAKHPNFYNAAKYGMGGYLLSKSLPVASLAVPGLGGVALRTGLNMPIAAGLAGNDTSNQDLAASATAVLYPAISGITAGVSKGAQYLSKKLGDEKHVLNWIQNTKQWLNGKTTNQLSAESIANRYNQSLARGEALSNKIRQVPLDQTAADQVIENTNPEINRILQQYTTQLNPAQQTVLHNIQQRVAHSNTIDHFWQLRKYINSQFKNFKQGQVIDEVGTLYNNVLDSVNNVIKSSADKVGKGQTWDHLNKLYSQVIYPLRELGAEDIASGLKGSPKEVANAVNLAKLPINLVESTDPQKLKSLLMSMDSHGQQIAQSKIVLNTLNKLVDNPDNFNYNTAHQKLSLYIEKYKQVLNKPAIHQLKGLQKLLTGLQSSFTPGGGYTARFATGPGLGATIGSAIGYKAGGFPGAVAGGAIGAFGGPMLMRQIKDLLASPTGLKLLQGLGEGKPWLNSIKQGLILAPARQLNDNPSP